MLTPDKNLVSVCGLFCPGCGLYYFTQENNEENLKKLAERMHASVDEIRCNGCRTQTKSVFCRDCYMIQCASEKGIDFCGSCPEYPCNYLKEFQTKMPHRVELWKSQERIKEIGWEAWFNEMVGHYSCKKCATVNGWYDFKCRHCENVPGSDFVEENKEALANRKTT